MEGSRASRGWQAGKIYFHKSSSLEIEISYNVSGLCEVRSIWANAVSRKARVVRSGLAKARVIE
jgi:hypothetical protein